MPDDLRGAVVMPQELTVAPMEREALGGGSNGVRYRRPGRQVDVQVAVAMEVGERCAGCGDIAFPEHLAPMVEKHGSLPDDKDLLFAVAVHVGNERSGER